MIDCTENRYSEIFRLARLEITSATFLGVPNVSMLTENLFPRSFLLIFLKINRTHRTPEMMFLIVSKPPGAET